MLKPCVGMMCEMSSSESFLRIVVFPLLSRPSTRMRASLSLRLSFRSSVRSPIATSPHTQRPPANQPDGSPGPKSSGPALVGFLEDGRNHRRRRRLRRERLGVSPTEPRPRRPQRTRQRVACPFFRCGSSGGREGGEGGRAARNDDAVRRADLRPPPRRPRAPPRRAPGPPPTIPPPPGRRPAATPAAVPVAVPYRAGRPALVRTARRRQPAGVLTARRRRRRRRAAARRAQSSAGRRGVASRRVLQSSYARSILRVLPPTRPTTATSGACSAPSCATATARVRLGSNPEQHAALDKLAGTRRGCPSSGNCSASARRRRRRPSCSPTFRRESPSDDQSTLPAGPGRSSSGALSATHACTHAPGFS